MTRGKLVQRYEAKSGSVEKFRSGLCYNDSRRARQID